MSNQLHEPLMPTTAFPNISQDILLALLPRLLADLGIDIGNTINASLLSDLSPQAYYGAASNIISTTQIFTVVVPSAFLYVIPAVYYPAEYKAAVVTQAILLAGGLGLLGAAISLGVGENFEGEVGEIVQTYTYIFAASLPFKLIATALSQLAPCLNCKNLQYIDAVLSFISMTGFSLVFVKQYPLSFLSPTQTIAGSYLLCSILRVLFYSTAYAYYFWNTIRFDMQTNSVAQLWSKGWKLAVQLGSELGGLYFLSYLVKWLLPDHAMNLSILNVMTQWFVFSIIAPIALAVTMMVKIGKIEQERIQAYVYSALRLVSVYHSLLLLGSIITPDKMVSLFMAPSENHNAGFSGSFRAMLIVTFVGLFFDSYKNIINMSYRALGQNDIPMIVSIVSIWGVGIPLAATLGYFLGVAGIVLGFSLGNIVAGSYLLSRFSTEENIGQASFLCKHCFYFKKDPEATEAVASILSSVF